MAVQAYTGRITRQSRQLREDSIYTVIPQNEIILSEEYVPIAGTSFDEKVKCEDPLDISSIKVEQEELVHRKHISVKSEPDSQVKVERESSDGSIVKILKEESDSDSDASYEVQIKKEPEDVCTDSEGDYEDGLNAHDSDSDIEYSTANKAQNVTEEIVLIESDNDDTHTENNIHNIAPNISKRKRSASCNESTVEEHDELPKKKIKINSEEEVCEIKPLRRKQVQFNDKEISVSKNIKDIDKSAKKSVSQNIQKSNPGLLVNKSILRSTKDSNEDALMNRSVSRNVTKSDEEEALNKSINKSTKESNQDLSGKNSFSTTNSNDDLTNDKSLTRSTRKSKEGIVGNKTVSSITKEPNKSEKIVDKRSVTKNKTKGSNEDVTVDESASRHAKKSNQDISVKNSVSGNTEELNLVSRSVVRGSKESIEDISLNEVLPNNKEIEENFVKKSNLKTNELKKVQENETSEPQGKNEILTKDNNSSRVIDENKNYKKHKSKKAYRLKCPVLAYLCICGSWCKSGPELSEHLLSCTRLQPRVVLNRLNS